MHYKGEANTYLISKQEFLEHVRSVNENLHGELNSFARLQGQVVRG